MDNKELTRRINSRFPFRNLNSKQRDMFLDILASFPNFVDHPKADLVEGKVPASQLPPQTDAGFLQALQDQQQQINSLQQQQQQNQQAISNLQQQLTLFGEIISFVNGTVETKKGIQIITGEETIAGGGGFATAYFTDTRDDTGEALFTQEPIVVAYSPNATRIWYTGNIMSIDYKSCALGFVEAKYNLLGIFTTIDDAPNGTPVKYFAIGV